MRFIYFLPWWIVAIGLAIVAGVTAYAYLHLRRPLSRRLRFFLIGLRISAASILLLCLLGPVLIERKDITPRTNLLILTDTSQSMGLEDVELDGQQIHRLTLVNRLLFDLSSQFLPDLANRFEVHRYRFDTQPQQLIESIEPLEAKGGLTDIASSIQSVLKEWRGQPLAGVVLITDGAHNASTFQIENVTDMQIPIYAVGVGNLQQPKDLKISKIEVSPVVYMEHDVPVRIAVQHMGYAGSKIRLSLVQVADSVHGGNRVVDAASITLTSQPTQVVEFTLNPQEEGSFQYVASVPILPDELTPENNEKVFPLKVVKTKLQILYIDGLPRWEYTFLKRTLERDPNIDPTCIILSSRTRNQLRGTLLERSSGYYPQTTELHRVPRFPETLDELLAYDVLIIGDLRATALTQAQQSAIVDFVEKHGKAIIFLGGRNSLGVNGLKKTPLEGLLPILIPTNGCFPRDEDFGPQLTHQGTYHPITRLGDTQTRVEAIWRDLPALSRWFGGFRLKGGATTLAIHRQPRSEKSMPVIIFQRSGLGKSLLIAAEGLWNWGFGVWSFKDEDDTYLRFWGQAIRWMATQADAKQINLTTDLTTYSVGDEVQITVYAYDESYQPLGDASLKIEVTPSDGKSFQVRTAASSQIPGGYTAQFRANQKGNYQIRASEGLTSSSLGEDSTEIFVQSPLAEFENPQLNERLLKQLAEKTGGVYTSIVEAESLPEKISDVQERVFATQERDLWDTPIVLILVVGLLGAEWFLRKRRGLV